MISRKPPNAAWRRYENGAAIPSLANLLCLRRPAIVVDEAHGARTDLSFEALARFNPACILELTATPTQPPKPNPSNVLYHVSAYELKAEHMIKLPIRLELRGQWREAIAAAVAKRNELQTLADAERALTGEYLRPIVLLQAQPKSKHGATLTVAAVRAALHDLGVPDEQIAEETGEVREVKAWEEKHGQTLFDERCPIRFIITVQALREGWDCPFAYVLCSVAELGTSTAVEQILGRVLRMPKATRKAHEDLNHAYAFVTSQRFGQVAATVEGLTQALEANGFTRFEAQQEIETFGTPVLPNFDGPLFGGVVAERPKTPGERRGEVLGAATGAVAGRRAARRRVGRFPGQRLDAARLRRRADRGRLSNAGRRESLAGSGCQPGGPTHHALAQRPPSAAQPPGAR